MGVLIGGFTFDGVNTSQFKLVGRSVKRPLLPAKRQKRLELAGVSGAYDFPGSGYSLREITMRIAYIGDNYHELRARARDIAAWLAQDDFCRLIMDDEPDKYYLAKVTSALDLQSLWQSGTVDVSFDCQPFAYSVEEQSVSLPAAGGIITNPGTRAVDFKSPHGSKFLITIANHGANVSLTMGGAVLSYSGSASGVLVFDNVEMTVTLGGANVFNALGGSIDTFFKMEPGANNLQVTGASGTVIVQYIPMWL